MTTVASKRITPSPQMHKATSTAGIMWTVSACLAPALLWGVYVFGFGALLVVAVSVVACVLVEWGMGALLSKRTLNDGSAVLTGLLIGMNMPPELPLYIPVVAAIVAIAIVKWTFGGLGSNWMNPALAGRVFVFFSWTGHMTSWKMPATLSGAAGVDSVSGATMLSSVKSGLFNYGGSAAGPAAMLSEQGYPRSNLDVRLVQSIGDLLEPLGVRFQRGYVDMFVGNIPGCIGEVSALLLLLGFVVLLARKIVSWHIPLSYCASFGLLVWALGGTRFGGGLFSGNVYFHLFTGGLMLGALYMATDMVTSPLTGKGMIIFGVGAGVMTFLVRFFGSFPEGVSLAIIFMNVFVPLIDRYTGPKRFGMQNKEGTS